MSSQPKWECVDTFCPQCSEDEVMVNYDSSSLGAGPEHICIGCGVRWSYAVDPKRDDAWSRAKWIEGLGYPTTVCAIDGCKRPTHYYPPGNKFCYQHWDKGN